MRTYLLAFICVFFTGSVTAQTSAPAPRSDTQVWNDTQLIVPLDKRFDFLLLGTLRVGRGVESLVEERAGFGLSYKPHERITVISGYQYIHMHPVPSRKSYEHRLTFGGSYRFPVKRFSISNRNLIERRLRSPQADSTRYRNRIQVEHPVTLGGRRFDLFVSDEIFYDFAVDALSRNRFIVGVGRRFNKIFASDFYFLRQSDGRARPGDLNIIGTTFRFNL